jgi:iron(III) transport system permease protein
MKALALLAVLSVAVGIPLAGVVARAGRWEHLVAAWVGARPEVMHSARLAGAGAALTVLFAIPLALAWVRRDAGGGVMSVPLVLLNLAVPGSLLALGVIAFPQPSSVRDSNGPLIFAYAARFTGVAVVVLYAGWVRLSPLPEWAARIHGVSPMFRWCFVTVPRHGPAVVAALFLVGLLAAAELEASLLLVRPGPTTLGVRLHTLIHTAPDHVVAALATVVLLATLGVVFVGGAALWLARRLLTGGGAR